MLNLTNVSDVDNIIFSMVREIQTINIDDVLQEIRFIPLNKVFIHSTLIDRLYKEFQLLTTDVDRYKNEYFDVNDDGFDYNEIYNDIIWDVKVSLKVLYDVWKSTGFDNPKLRICLYKRKFNL